MHGIGRRVAASLGAIWRRACGQILLGLTTNAFWVWSGGFEGVWSGKLSL